MSASSWPRDGRTAAEGRRAVFVVRSSSSGGAGRRVELGRRRSTFADERVAAVAALRSSALKDAHLPPAAADDRVGDRGSGRLARLPVVSSTSRFPAVLSAQHRCGH